MATDYTLHDAVTTLPRTTLQGPGAGQALRPQLPAGVGVLCVLLDPLLLHLRKAAGGHSEAGTEQSY